MGARDTKTNVKNPAGEHSNAPSEGRERAGEPGRRARGGEGAALAAPGGWGRGPGAPARRHPASRPAPPDAAASAGARRPLRERRPRLVSCAGIRGAGVCVPGLRAAPREHWRVRRTRERAVPARGDVTPGRAHGQAPTALLESAYCESQPSRPFGRNIRLDPWSALRSGLVYFSSVSPELEREPPRRGPVLFICVPTAFSPGMEEACFSNMLMNE